MYNTRTGLVIAFHGCDKLRQQELLAQPERIHFSTKPHDWLGHGMYFWENNYSRAMQWAIDKCRRSKARIEPAVVGAVIDLNYCLDLLDEWFIKMLKTSYDLMSIEYRSMGIKLPVNRDSAGDTHKDKLVRLLDCSTIEFMHESIRKKVAAQIGIKGYASMEAFDSVRGVFLEGGEAYPGAGISAKSHIQLCIRNPNCIKGFFQAREEIDFIRQEIFRDQEERYIKHRKRRPL